MFVNIKNLERSFVGFKTASPFSFCIIEHFFEKDIALGLEKEFPEYDSDKFNGIYNNAIEIKKSCNIWDRFPSLTYNVFQYLNSVSFLKLISRLTESNELIADYGLHGGGWHIHPPKGKLNVHLDYNLHPKMKLQRKFNLLIYLNSNYKDTWGGNLGLWSHDESQNAPKDLIQSIEPKFNRAVLFDTTQDSWHGLEIPNSFPDGEYRKSLALYYLVDNQKLVDTRSRALFYPTKEQENNIDVLELIKRRSATSGEDPTTWSRS
jgi:hypothetical protein